MNPITTTEALAASGYTAAANYGRTTQDAKAAKESQSADSSNVKKTTVTNGRTIGEPKLSEKAQKYYDQLRKKIFQYGFYSCQQRYEAAGAGECRQVCKSKPHGSFDR